MTIQHRDHEFEPYITSGAIQSRVEELGQEIGRDYSDKYPLLIGVLNGAFMFTADLMRAITIPTEVSFVKYASYEGTSSTGEVKALMGIRESLEGRHVIIVEDIIDTGRTMQQLLATVKEQNPASVAVASCLLKPEMLEKPIDIDYLGFEIPNRFVIGYGLDFDGFGRHLPDLYQLTNT